MDDVDRDDDEADDVSAAEEEEDDSRLPPSGFLKNTAVKGDDGRSTGAGAGGTAGVLAAKE